MDEERKVVTLSDENGNEEEFELIDFVDYQEKTYAIFTPYVEEEDDDDEGDVEVVIMETTMETSDEGEEMALNFVDDEALCNQILEAFTEQVATYEVEDGE